MHKDQDPQKKPFFPYQYWSALIPFVGAVALPLVLVTGTQSGWMERLMPGMPHEVAGTSMPADGNNAAERNLRWDGGRSVEPAVAWERSLQGGREELRAWSDKVRQPLTQLFLVR